jgi:DnaJ family protein C protein 13
MVFCRENGLEVLYQAFERCISVLSNSSKPDEVAVQVCVHITRFYSVASMFQMCRDRMVEMPELVKNVCRLFYYKVNYSMKTRSEFVIINFFSI